MKRAAAPDRIAPTESAATGVTVGVEEEFLLIDATSGTTVPRAPEVLANAMHRPRSAADAALHSELLSSQVEAATGRCTTMSEVTEQLRHGRHQLSGAARAQGMRLLPSGTPVLAARLAPVTRSGRFRDIARSYGGMLDDYQVCGCHVHIGVSDRETAVAVTNHLRPWLPSLLALSANSPFHLGRDTGYASWRMVLQSRFPGSGVPPHFASAAAYEEQLQRLVDCGVLMDTGMSFWLVRPSPRLPTVEFRVADALATVEEAVLQAAISRALVRTALAEIDMGRRAPRVSEQVAAAGVWCAARYGLDGPAAHPFRETQVEAKHLIHELLSWVSPALHEAGDHDLVREAYDHVSRAGTGAARQRLAATEGLRATVAMLSASE